ncbi:hypothetical protein EDD15DRAFT_2204517 [Pisolithus albus]|nr:hypothetical protein EDD15DRAFT_2204517 [Pisolithus albus]
MIDLFFPVDPPPRDELQLIDLIRYMALPPEGDKFVVQAMNTDYNTFACDPFDVPSYYYEHVRRFIWRHRLFIGVEKQADKLSLAVGLPTRLQRYISYLDAMIEGLFVEARRSQGNDWRSSLFDLYLSVDYFVGRHEHNRGNVWREHNPDKIMTTVDVTTLDWRTFYDSADVNDPVWSGLSYQFDVANVAESEWQVLADAAAKYFGLTNPEVKFTSVVVFNWIVMASEPSSIALVKEH